MGEKIKGRLSCETEKIWIFGLDSAAKALDLLRRYRVPSPFPSTTARTLPLLPLLLLFRPAATLGTPSDYAKLPLGWQLSGMSDIAEVGPCNASQPYVPPPAILDLCTSPLYKYSCLSTNYIPVQPVVNKKCAWLKTGTANDKVVSFVHRTRCTASLNGTIVASTDGTAFKFCPAVGDAFFDVMQTVTGNMTSYDQCTGLCDADPGCAAVQTDGQACTLLATHAKGGWDSWFRLSFNFTSGASSEQ